MYQLAHKDVDASISVEIPEHGGKRVGAAAGEGRALAEAARANIDQQFIRGIPVPEDEIGVAVAVHVAAVNRIRA